MITTTSDKYATLFGFTEKEVFAALDEAEIGDEKEKVKEWYDGFVFGKHKDIYNPWSILNFVDKGEYKTYWANTSSNSLVGKLIKEGTKRIKTSFEALLRGEKLVCTIDEQVVYDQLKGNESAIWSLLVACGYLKVLSAQKLDEIEVGMSPQYELDITNQEVRFMFNNMVKNWFGHVEQEYGDFLEALILGDVDAMNEYMNEVSYQMFSYFDTGIRASKAQPERFYHGFVLGLLVDLKGRFVVTSNRESGFGRYDIMLEPVNMDKDDAIIIEFKVFNPRKEKNIKETLKAAHSQIEEKLYEASLVAKGIPKEKIRKYGFAFEGKTVLIG